MATPAMASPGCTAANAGAFNLTVATGTNRLQQFNGQFDAGDIVTIIVAGTPLSLFADLISAVGGAPQKIVSVANANGSGSATVASSGNNIIDIAVAAGAGGATNLAVTCTPVAGGGGTAPGTPQAAAEQADTATNATTTSAIVENRTVNGIIDGASKVDPKRERYNALVRRENQLRAERDQKAIRLWAERDALLERAAVLVEDLDHFQEDRDSFGVVGSDELSRMFGVQASDLEDGQQIWLKGAKAEAQQILNRIKEIDNIIDEEELPFKHELPKPRKDDDIELGDGESILFVGQDPFTRALARYRGFRLDVADTGEGFSESVKPLSFTQTLSSTIVGWVRAVYTDYEQDDASQHEGDNILVALGVHKDFNDELSVGLFATTTWGDVQSPVNALDIDSQGYSLGTYGRYKWGEIDLNASARVGLTDNDISVGGTTGSYDTRLASLTFGISGQEQLTDSVWMRPAISLTNTWVNREDYVNSAGTNIGGNTTWSGNVSAGPTIGTSLTPPSGFRRLEPAIGLQATYNYSDQDTQAGTVTTSDTDYLSLSVSPQLSMEFDNGASLDVFGSYFGIGADLDGWSVGGTLSIPLN